MVNDKILDVRQLSLYQRLFMSDCNLNTKLPFPVNKIICPSQIVLLSRKDAPYYDCYFFIFRNIFLNIRFRILMKSRSNMSI